MLNGITTPIPVNGLTNRLTNASYDANGNMTSGSGATLQYDVANRITSATPVSGGTEYYAYSLDNKGVHRQMANGSEEWVLWGAHGEKLGAFTIYCNYAANSCAYYYTLVNPTLYFAGPKIRENLSSLMTDRLGTNRAAGARFYPYGEEITSTGNDRTKFATYNRDSFTGLDYADQRYYASSYGRFSSPDPLKHVSIADPTTWNQFACLGGDPVNNSDPSGLDPDNPNTWNNVPNAPYFCWDSDDENGPPHTTCLGNNGPAQTQGKAKARFLHVADPSKAGPNEDKIDSVLNWIGKNLDPDCANWLNGAGEAISSLIGTPGDPNSGFIGHGTYDVGVSAFTNSGNTDLPAGYAITVNDAGVFFNATSNGMNFTVGGCTGGTGEAQVFTCCMNSATC